LWQFYASLRGLNTTTPRRQQQQIVHGTPSLVAPIGRLAKPTIDCPITGQARPPLGRRPSGWAFTRALSCRRQGL